MWFRKKVITLHRIVKMRQMKFSKIALVAVGSLFVLSAAAQDSDPVIMTINGKNIKRSEFEYSFNKNNTDGVIDKKTVKEYVPLYVDFKLKVAAAEEARYDTISSIRKELYGYREQMLMPTIVDNDFIEREARKTYDNTAARFGGQDMLTASHILVLMRQDADAAAQQAAKARIDSIYNVLKAVPSDELAGRFAELAKECSDDKGSAVRGGSLGQFGKGMMIPDFENAAFALKAGEMSAPVLSTVGYHIIYMAERHPFEPYEYHHDNIIKFLEQRGIKEASANAYVDSLARQREVGREVIVDELYNQMIAKDADARNLAQEYYDGTLMYEISKNEVWDKAQQDEKGLEAFYKVNKKNFKWDAPRFCGLILHAKDAAAIAKAKKIAKATKNEEDWAKAIVAELNTDSVKAIRIERGIFKQGDNQNVDNLIFKDKSKALKPQKDYPETDVLGKIYKKPRTYKDVRGMVTSEYQNMKEKEWVESLRAKFAVKVNDDVVETVNKH